MLQEMIAWFDIAKQTWFIIILLDFYFLDI